MANRFRRVPLAAEVNAFKAEVGGDERFVSPWKAQNRTIVANAGNNPVVRHARRTTLRRMAQA